MTRPTKTWLIALGVFLAYILVAVLLALVLRLHGARMWQMIGALSVLGILSAAILLWFRRDDLRVPKVGTPASSIDATIAAARVQLASSNRVAKAKFGSLPVLLVLGPEGSTKTTTVIRSGLEPELLAGDVFRGETVAPTSGVNLWYSQNSVVVEAGSPVLSDISAWQRLVRALRPRSLRSALTGRAQSPRLALVCFGCDEFYKPGSGEAVPAAARDIRARLGDAAKQFGVQLPTYVLFTKLDQVPNFEAFMRNFSSEEAREALGAAVAPDGGDAGTYADRVTPRLEQSFSDLYTSLAERRLQTLAREHAPEIKPGAYEFPREFNKLRALAVDFLREIGRPSELAVSPVLRGFYFTGVQAVFISDATPEYAPAAAAQAQVAGVRSATAVFGALGSAAAPVAPPPSAGGGRKVPRWDFLPRVMREVVFGDQAAVRLTSAGARVNFWRRVGLGAAAVVAILLTTAFAWSYSGNKQLQRDALTATRGIAALAPNPVDLPPVDALQKLEALRTQVDTLSAFEREGAPTGLRWGLYSGSAAFPEVRRAYFAGFNKLMFSGTRESMLRTLRGLPDTPRPTDDYGSTYTLLKAYIITTSHPEKSTTEFLSPALMTTWLAGRSLDTTRSVLGRRQFETYATELKYGKPFPDTADAATVAKARSFLRQFAGSESIYQGMLAEASKTNPPIQFNRKFPGSATYVLDGYEVPGAFTKGGAAFMLSAFKTVDKYLAGENWVVGDDRAAVDKAKLIADLNTRYSNDYVAHWKKYLASATVQRYSGVKDAGAKLAVLSGNQSPLLALFSLASQNTDVALPDVKAVFQPVQLVMPPTMIDKFVGEKNGPYMSALLTFQTSVDKTANSNGEAGVQAAAAAATDASTARNAAKQLAAGFTIDPQGVNSIVQNLMEAPITNVEGFLKTFGASEINTRARQFCAQARGLLTKFPFSGDATASQASLADVAAVLKPGSGSLWRFYDEALAAMLPRQGNVFTPNPAGTVKFSPGFVTLLNKAAAWSDIMFKDNSPEPHLAFTVSPVPSESFSSVSVTLDGEVIRSRAGGNVEIVQISWPGQGQHDAKLSAALGTAAELPMVGPYSGPWAVFQLFNVADDWKEIPGKGYRVGWDLTTRAQRATSGQSARITLEVTGNPASLTVLRKGAFAGADCGGDVAR